MRRYRHLLKTTISTMVLESLGNARHDLKQCAGQYNNIIGPILTRMNEEYNHVTATDPNDANPVSVTKRKSKSRLRRSSQNLIMKLRRFHNDKSVVLSIIEGFNAPKQVFSFAFEEIISLTR